MCSTLISLLVLHPAFKLTYFRKRRWPEEWIEAATNLVKEEWTKNYKPAALEIVSAPKSSEVFCLFLLYYMC